nr:MAG TPA: conotoxin [Microviridae sp.]
MMFYCLTYPCFGTGKFCFIWCKNCFLWDY